MEGPPPPAIYRAPVAPSAWPAVEDEARALLDAIVDAAPIEMVRIQHELLRLGPGSHVVLAETLLDGDAAPAKRQVSAFVLGEADTAAACVTLSGAWAERPESWRVAVSIAVAAGRCESVGPLLATLALADDVDVQLKAAVALGLFGVRSALPDVRALADEVEGPRREFAVLSAALLGDVSAGAALDARTGPLDALPPDVRPFYALAFTRVGLEREGAVDALRAAATRNPDPIVRQLSLEVLAARADDFARTLLTTARSDPSPRVRAVAGSLLEAAGP
jgi:HEAT repeat protein